MFVNSGMKVEKREERFMNNVNSEIPEKKGNRFTQTE